MTNTAPWTLSPQTKIVDAEFNTRASNVLSWLPGLVTLEDLSHMTRRELLSVKNSGEKTVRHIEDVLSFAGLTLTGLHNGVPAPAPEPTEKPEPTQYFERSWIERSDIGFIVSADLDGLNPYFISQADEIIDPLRIIAVFNAGVEEGKRQIRAEFRRVCGIK